MPAGGPAERARGDLGVLIVVLDACRPDRMGCYGYDRPTTPNLDALAAEPESTVFTRHHVQSSWTKPSTASLFTGLFVHQHGVVVGHEETDRKSGVAVFATQALSLEFTTMAELFSEAGYTTFSVAGHRHLSGEYGFDQGFDEYVLERPFSDEEKVERVLEILRRTRNRYLGYLHARACHNPFPPDRRDDDYMRRFGFEYDEAARIDAGVDFTKAAIKFAIRDGKISLDPEDTRFLGLVYDATLRKVDRDIVASLIAGLKALGWYDSTLLIITADHGEALYEHRDYAHTGILADTVIRAPLIVKFPKGQKPPALGPRDGGLSRSVDLLPSLLAHLGIPIPSYLPGARLFEGGTADFTLAEQDGGWALHRDGYKLVLTAEGPSLFDINLDPGEESNLAGRSPDQAAAMKAFAASLFARRGDLPVSPAVDTPLDEETLEELRSLGYVR